MRTRDEYVRTLQLKLEEWNMEIDLLSEKAGKLAADAKNEYQEQIETLQEKQEAARQKIEEINLAGGESAWEDMKAGVELAWSALAEAMDSARSRFQ